MGIPLIRPFAASSNGSLKTPLTTPFAAAGPKYWLPSCCLLLGSLPSLEPDGSLSSAGPSFDPTEDEVQREARNSWDASRPPRRAALRCPGCSEIDKWLKPLHGLEPHSDLLGSDREQLLKVELDLRLRVAATG